MPFTKHQRLTISGTLYGIENFSVRLNMSDPPAGADREAYMTDLVADVTAYWTRPLTKIFASSVVREIKLARINELGKYSEDPIIRAVTIPGAVAGSGVSVAPQIALAVSLGTAMRGPRGRGRFFLPVPALNMDAEGAVSVADAEGIRDSTVTFLNNINNRSGPDVGAPEVIIASSFGTNSVVNGVRVGRVLDTMRSRRRDLPEKYTSEAPVS